MSSNTIATGPGRSILTPGADTPRPTWLERGSRAETWAVAVTALALGLAYAPNLHDLYATWTTDSNYSHGLFIIPIALIIFWQRYSGAKPEPSSHAAPARWWGWVFLIAILLVRAVAYERSFQWSETATVIPAIACLAWTFGGGPLLRIAWPAILFLVFMLPLPQTINNLVALPLQWIAATGSCFILQLSGLWAIQEGNTINLTTPHGADHLDVANVCSGLRMLMTLAATVAATIILIPLPNWKRIVLLISAIPIAIASNMVRIVATGWSYYFLTEARHKREAHDWTGYLMPVLAVILVWLELRILSWLVPEENESSTDDRKAILPLLTERKK